MAINSTQFDRKYCAAMRESEREPVKLISGLYSDAIKEILKSELALPAYKMHLLWSHCQSAVFVDDCAFEISYRYILFDSLLS